MSHTSDLSQFAPPPSIYVSDGSDGQISGHWIAYSEDGSRTDLTVGGGGGGGAVSSVFGRTGAVVAVSGDYSADYITVAATPTNYTAATTDVEAHLAGIDTALATAGGATPASAISPASTDAVGVVGTSTDYARQDHKHPAQGVSGDILNKLTLGTDGLHLFDHTALLATSVSPAADDAVGLVGISEDIAREDHKHPVQTAGVTTVVATGFSGNLSGTDTDVQTALTTIDGLAISASLYSADGTLAANRIVTGGGNNLTFTGLGSLEFHGTWGSINAGTGVSVSTSTGPLSLQTSNGLATFGSTSAAAHIVSNNVNFEWPTADGTANQVLATDGSGVLSWLTSAGNLYSEDGTLTANRTITGGGFDLLTTGLNSLHLQGAVTTVVSDGVLSLQAGNGALLSAGTGPLTIIANSETYTWPTADGTSGQALVTDGSGVLSWTSAVSSIYSANGTLTGDRTITGGGNTVSWTGLGGFNVTGSGQSVWNMGGAIFLNAAGTSHFTTSSGSMTIGATAIGGGVNITNGAVSHAWPSTDGTAGQLMKTDGAGNLGWVSAGAGDVVGPASATNNAFAVFDTTTGKLLRNQTVMTHNSGSGQINIAGSGLLVTGGTAGSVGPTYGYLADSGAGNGGGGASGTYSISCNDRVKASEFNTLSDSRLKDIVARVEDTDSLEVINNLVPTNFTWKRDGDDAVTMTGLIAQEVGPVVPNAVTMHPSAELEDEHSISLTPLVAHLIGAVKALTAKVEMLEAAAAR